MDANQVVGDGARGLARIADAIAATGLPIEGVYLIGSVDDGRPSWHLRVITAAPSRRVIETIIDLQRDGRLPRIDPGVGIKSVSADNVEASRIVAYARKAFKRPVEIVDTPIDGMFIEYALVADWPTASDRAAA